MVFVRKSSNFIIWKQVLSRLTPVEICLKWKKKQTYFKSALFSILALFDKYSVDLI